jgi:aminomethyltransferase
MIDLTPLRKFEVVGSDAEVFMQYAITRNVRRVSVGEIVYSAICNETGGMIDDGTLFKMSDQAFRWVCGDPYTGKWLRELAEKTGHQVTVRESTDQLHNVAVQGPNSRALLQELIWTPEHQTDVADLAWFHFTIGRLGGPTGTPVMVSRTGSMRWISFASKPV